ncbi:MAG: GHKL domain-containing protein [Oscillospiraceae bacterium]|nr:GHKL domain-containing protein [Oscillospiraceae bacterium]
MAYFITMFFFLAFSFYTYSKILNLKNVALCKIAWAMFFVVILTISMHFSEPYIPSLRFAFLALIGGVFSGLITRTRLDISITSFSLANGITYGFWFISLMLVHLFFWLLPVGEYDILIALLAALIQFGLIYGLFSIRRMRKGMPFLRERGAGAAGLVVSGIILTTILLLPNENISDEVRLVMVAGAIVSVAGIVIWWRRRLVKLYKKNIQQRYIQDLEESLAKYEAESKEMTTLFHKDNKLWAGTYEITGHCAEIADKLLPLWAELETVNDNGKLVAVVKDCADAARRIASLQRTIEELLHDRMAIANKTQREFKVLPTTNDALFDGVMQSMLARANEREILFDFTLMSDIHELLETIESVKLSTLLADLLENAIIATSQCNYKHIFLNFSFNEGSYELSVQDSGIHFAQHTLEKLGKERASTHLDEGGSGIGYMTIFEILREYNASLSITQYPTTDFSFTKIVTVRFDGKDEYTFRNKF